MQYGRRITTQSYHNGTLKTQRVEYQVPELIMDKTQALSEVMKAIDLITTKQTHKLTIIVEADPRTHHFKSITKQYAVEE